MALSSNQFKFQVVKGFVDASTPNRLLPAKIASSESNTLVAGQLVKIKDEASKLLPLVGSSATTDRHAGVLVITTHRESFVAGNVVEFAPLGSGAIVVCEASGAIGNGAPVYYGANAKVASSGTVPVGHAFDKATASGDLIRVCLDIAPSST